MSIPIVATPDLLLWLRGPRTFRSTSPDESDHRSKPPDPNHRSESEGGGRTLAATVICRIGVRRSPRESPHNGRTPNKELCQVVISASSPDRPPTLPPYSMHGRRGH